MTKKISIHNAFKDFFILKLSNSRDFGIGINKKDLPHVFERFYKGENSSNDSIGIGLALAKSIIQNNDGYIDVESEEGKGTLFTIKYFNKI